MLKKIPQLFGSKKRPDIFAIILLIIVAIGSHLQWFNPHSILEFGDWQYRPDEHVRQLLISWNSWIPFNGVGEVNILMAGFPLRGLMWPLIVALGFSYDIATKLTLFVPVAIGGFLAPYILMRRLIKEMSISIVVALIYGSTTYFLILQTAHLPIAFAYCLLPFLVYILDKAIEENKAYQWVLLSLLFSAGSFYEVRIMYIFSFILMSYFLFITLARKINPIKYWGHILLSVILFSLMSVFWLIPTKLAAGGSLSSITERGIFGNDLFNLQQAFTITKWNWTGGLVDRTFTAQSIPIYLWLIPIVAFAGVATVGKYRKPVLFFLFFTLVTIFLAKQSTPPISFAYEWLYENFPGFNLFREASKFYTPTAFGFMGLLAYSLLNIKGRSQGSSLQKKLYPLVLLLLLIVVGLNLKPAITGEIGGTFKSAQMPEDYKILKKFIASQANFGRILWIPRESWWGYYDNNHPKVRAVDIIDQQWGSLTQNLRERSKNIGHQSAELLEEKVGEALIHNSSIKYVVVPTRDAKNDDDFFIHYGDDRQFYLDVLDDLPWLKRINIGTKELAIYENTRSLQYFSVPINIYKLDSLSNLSDLYRFQTRKLKDDTMAFVAGDNKLPGEGLVDVFQDLTSENLSANSINKSLDEGPGRLLLSKAQPKVSYSVTPREMKFIAHDVNSVYVNGLPAIIKNIPDATIASIDLNADKEYFIALGDRLVHITPTGKTTHNLGQINQPLSVYSGQKHNLIQNPSLEQGLWKKQVGDCNKYDGKPELGMGLDEIEKTDGNKSLRLEARRHIACTGPSPIPVKPGTHYALQIDYRSQNKRFAGYTLRFDDPKKTTIEKRNLRTSLDNWLTSTELFLVPPGAHNVTLLLKGYPDGFTVPPAITYYDNLKLIELNKPIILPVSFDPGYKSLSLAQGSIDLMYKSDSYDGHNLIQNPSLEQGLWKKQVGDCNKYDGKPELGMGLDEIEKTDGNKSLRLEARRHIACTGPSPIPVKENSTYMFSFKYQSPNSKEASYYIKFDDNANSSISEDLHIKDKSWRSYGRQIRVPEGARKMTIVVYAFADSQDNIKIINRYDDFRLQEIPDLQNRYFFVGNPSLKFIKPRGIDFQISNPTRKVVNIKGIRGPFYLRMSEAYNARWRLILNNQKTNGKLSKWVPWAKPDTVSEENHFKLNDFLNGWYIDTNDLCVKRNLCQKDTDGTYDIKLIAEFTPQRWFYLGSLISGATFLGSMGYLAWDWRKRHKQKMLKIP